MAVIGSIYLLHFEPGLPNRPGSVVRHYLGWTEGDVQVRIDTHLRGAGSPLVRAVVQRGGTVTLARTWAEVDRNFERRLKRRRETPRMCPLCVAAGHTGGRALLGAIAA